MKTAALIDLLAHDAGPAPRALAARRLSAVLVLGWLFSAGLALALFGAIPAAMYATAAPWLKLAYTGALAAAALRLTARLSCPGATSRPALHATVAVVLTMALAGAAAGWQAPADSRWPALLGHSWSSCPLSVLALSLPALAAALWAARGLAPTRPHAAGFAAGVLAGALGAGGYALSCTEASTAFVAVWYTLGIALTGGVGALLGPRVLRW